MGTNFGTLSLSAFELESILRTYGVNCLALESPFDVAAAAAAAAEKQFRIIPVRDIDSYEAEFQSIK